MTTFGARARSRRAVLRSAALALLAFGLLVGGLAGCSASSRAATGARINVTMHDFAIAVSRRSVPAGPVVLRVTNDGPSTHEINVDRTGYAAAKFPLKRDGLTVEEDAKGLRRIDSIEQLNLHQTRDLALDLKPGRYVLWCNLEGHYLGGMHETFDVR
jgi:uncharacterized cupredoxin-like copper-binding protein